MAAIYYLPRKARSMSTDSSHRTRTNRPNLAEVTTLPAPAWDAETVRREQYLTADRDYWRRRAEQAEAKLAKLNTVSVSDTVPSP